jgi:hypothetical protein
MASTIKTIACAFVASVATKITDEVLTHLGEAWNILDDSVKIVSRPIVVLL